MPRLEAEGPRHRCGRCLRRPPPYDRLLSGWIYESPLDAVITGLKFKRLDYLGTLLGEALVEDLGSELGEDAHPEQGLTEARVSRSRLDLVVPVPLHWRRRLGRGYNQAAEIARPIATHLKIPLRSILSRRRATAPQTSLERGARGSNLRHAFSLTRPDLCAGKRILLIDDVLTTGSTLNAAASLLRRSGAGSITALVAARTPSPKEAAALTPLPNPRTEA